MAHHHDHNHYHNSGSNIKLAFFLNLGFTLLEIIGGLWTNSVAILSDALHDLGDSFSLGLAWYMDSYSKKENDSTFSYGYRRFSLLGALINTIVLVVGSVFILTEAIPRLLNPEAPNVRGMILFAVVGISVNGFAAYRASHGSSMNEKVISWHLIEDVLGWVAVLIASIVMLFVDLPIIDPILSILITLYILKNVLGYLKQTMTIFLQAVPDNIDLGQFEEQLCAIEPVHSVHHTHLWSLDGEQNVLTSHLLLPADAARSTILSVKRQVQALAKETNLAHITIEIERTGEDCIMQEQACDHVHEKKGEYVDGLPL